MNYIPETPNNYIGKQVIINSDRLIFNAKNDSILLFSDKAIGFSTNGNFHFDTFNELIDVISGILDDIRQKISYNCTGKVTGPRSINKSALQGRYDDLENLKSNIKDIMSKRINLV